MRNEVQAAAGPPGEPWSRVTPVTATARQMHALHAEKPKYVLGAFGGIKGKPVGAHHSWSGS